MAVALPTAADPPGRVLHRPIPGDLPIDSRPEGSPILPPASAQSMSQSAGATSAWHENQPVDESVTRPRDSWQTPLRELDRDTRSPPGAALRYQEIFTPSVTPFKRMQAYDVVDEYGRLTVRDPSLRPIEMGEGPIPARWNHQATARFVGDLNVEVSPSRSTPIPGIAGDQRVVSYTTSSSHTVEFAQDGAGNLFVRGSEAETVRLTYVLEAPQSAFTAAFVPSEPLDRAAGEVPAASRPNVPQWLQNNAEAVLHAANVSRYQSLHAVVNGLVAYFRSFRDDDLPASAAGQNLYADLALNRVGACRHRAYAFVLTLHALGIEARYVGNEAHAWAEVNFRSGNGWSRIDLGGWDIPLDAQASTDRPQFHPANQDPFPRPANYESQYSARTSASDRTPAGEPTTTGGNGNASGAAGSGAMPNDGQGETSSSSSGGGGAAGAGGGDGGASGASSNPGGASGTGANINPGGAAGSTNPGGASGAINPGGGAGAINPGGVTPTPTDDEEPAHSVMTMSAIEADRSAGYAVGTNGFVRGSIVAVAGDLHDASGAAVGGLTVEIQLLRDRRVIATIGRTVSQADGHWVAQSQIPFDLATGEYVLRAQTPGDRTHSAATVE